jgi:hypothetical protein
MEKTKREVKHHNHSGVFDPSLMTVRTGQKEITQQMHSTMCACVLTSECSFVFQMFVVYLLKLTGKPCHKAIPFFLIKTISFFNL